jgi:hypothetical protein
LVYIVIRQKTVLLKISQIQNLDAWEEAKREIEKIPEHPNKVPQPEQGPDGSSEPARRNSSSTVNGR